MPHKLVLIEWIDSAAGGGWQPLDKIRGDHGVVHCRSVGWLVESTRAGKTLVPHISGEKNGDVRLCGCGEMTIPARCITRMRVLSRA